MKDPTGKLVQGRTRWRRFMIILGPAFGIVALMMYLVATGVLALNLAISGVPFVLSANSLSGDNFVQYGAPTQVTNTNAGTEVAHELSVNGMTAPGSPSQVNAGNGKTFLADTVTLLQNARIVNLSQTVCAPLSDVGIAGFLSLPDLQVNIGSTGTATADFLTVQAPALTAGSATFSHIIIGEDAQTAAVGYGYPGAGAIPGGVFSQAADSVTITTLKQIAVGTEAGTFTLPNLTLSAGFVASCP